MAQTLPTGGRFGRLAFPVSRLGQEEETDGLTKGQRVHDADEFAPSHRTHGIQDQSANSLIIVYPGKTVIGQNNAAVQVPQHEAEDRRKNQPEHRHRKDEPFVNVGRIMYCSRCY